MHNHKRAKRGSSGFDKTSGVAARASVILGPDGRPAVVSAERVHLHKQTRFNPLRNWTPDVLTRQLEAYARGEIAGLSWVMEWLEQHDDVIACVAPKAKAAVASWGYDVLPRDEIKPEQKGMAEDQQGLLQEFFQSLETSDAVDLEECGKMRLLVTQIMDAYGKRHGAHHVIWKPSRQRLQAECVKVPTYFFEVTTGRMRFLPTESSQRGVELDTLGGRGAWMTYRGRGVMLAGVLCRMFKQLPLQDWLTYCDRHGMPAFLGKTRAKQGSQEWNDMADAVASIGSEWGAVVNTDDVIDVLSLAGTGELPYEKLVDRMDRAQVMLWLGGDLSTISRENGTGSNPQQDDSDKLHADNAAWVSEVINRNLSQRVIRYYFGPNAPELVELRLRTETRTNVAQELSVVQAAKGLGVRISKSWFTGKFGVVEADEGEAALGEAVTPPTVPAVTNALNSAADMQALLTDSLATALGVRTNALSALDEFFAKLSKKAESEKLTDDDFLALMEAAVKELPELFSDTMAADLASELEAAMGTATLNGMRAALREAKES
jgi:phage gp29-like protein